MSRETTINVTCPNCKKESPFLMWESINTQINPEMKEKVKDRSAFLFECPSCGNKTFVNYGFLYHQMEDRIMIFMPLISSHVIRGLAASWIMT